jgi:predicted DNA-binding transcriptional regulator YafY
VDRVERVEVLAETFVPPSDLDPVATIAEHLAEGWRYDVDIVIDAPAAAVAEWIPRNRGRLEVIDADHTRLVATTDEPSWYCQQLVGVNAPFHIRSPDELRATARAIGHRLQEAGDEATLHPSSAW